MLLKHLTVGLIVGVLAAAGTHAALPYADAGAPAGGDRDGPMPLEPVGNPRFLDHWAANPYAVPRPPDDSLLADCNGNDIPDDQDISEGTSLDDNNNGIPDECELFVPLDIKPGSCPNPLNPGSDGVLPVAIVGTAGFDVTMINIDSLRMYRADGVGASVPSHEGPPGPHTVYEDVATPLHAPPCQCHDRQGDEILDLSIKFETDEVVAQLLLDDANGSALQEFLELVVTGALDDGTRFEARDCIRPVPPQVPTDAASAPTDGDTGSEESLGQAQDRSAAQIPGAAQSCGAGLLSAGLLSLGALCATRLRYRRRTRRPAARR